MNIIITIIGESDMINTKALILAASAAAIFTAGCSCFHHGPQPVDKFGKPVGHSWHHPKKNSCGAG